MAVSPEPYNRAFPWVSLASFLPETQLSSSELAVQLYRDCPSMSPDRLDMGIRGRRTERPPTQEVAAATSRGATNPASLVDGHLPFVEGIVFQGIRCEVADLHFVKMGLEVLECHPETEARTRYRASWPWQQLSARSTS